MSSDTSSTLIEVVPVSPFDEDAIGEAFDLGCRAKATLGPQMRGAYEGAAAKGHLLVAKSGNSIVGFALYGVAYGRVRLAYLCVTDLWRRQGVAHALVDHISQTHHDLAGISVKCRNSYDIDKVWISLGFHKRSEVRGRSQAGHLLTGWWRDHGHPDLFSRPEPPLLRAALDNNIIRDLGPTRDRDGAADSIALTADHLTDQLELIVTTSVRREIADVEDKPFREACERAMTAFTQVAPSEVDVNQVRQELLSRVSSADGPYPAGGNDEYDLRHVASAVVAKAGVFVTRDVRLISILRDPGRRLGMRILEPADVIVHIDELLRADAYRPVALLGTGYQLAALGAGQGAAIEHLASDAMGERRREFMRRIRSLTTVGGARHVIFAPDGSVAALYGLAERDGVLEVPVFRVAPQPLADTIARQVLLILRNRCRDAHLNVIRVSDPHLGPGVQLALLEDGYQHVGGDWLAFVIDHCGAVPEIERQVFAAARRVGLPEPPSLRSSMAADVAAKFERKWWPAKIVDSALPTYVVSIQQRWSNQLFGVPASLWRETLGLSREHVYYRGAANRVCRAPGRILWYMSGNRPSAPGIVACSQLELDVVGAPRELHERFRHLGVWELGHIQEAGTGALRQALRVTGTEIFPNPIPLPRLMALSGNQRGFCTRCRRAASVRSCSPAFIRKASVNMSHERAALLLSVRPRFAEAILSGIKTVEVRRRRIGAAEGSAVVLYASSPVMAVVGTARLERTELLPIDQAWQAYGHTMGVSREEFDVYLSGSRLACLLFLCDAIPLGAPLALDQLRKGRRFHPPQSYRYVGTSDPRPIRKLANR